VIWFVSPDGIEALCKDVKVDHTDVRILILAWYISHCTFFLFFILFYHLFLIHNLMFIIYFFIYQENESRKAGLFYSGW
jgi:hypothetical protein